MKLCVLQCVRCVMSCRVGQPTNHLGVCLQVKEPGMAPEGKHCLHAYLPATEPYHIWKGVKKGRWVHTPSLQVGLISKLASRLVSELVFRLVCKLDPPHPANSKVKNPCGAETRVCLCLCGAVVVTTLQCRVCSSQGGALSCAVGGAREDHSRHTAASRGGCGCGCLC